MSAPPGGGRGGRGVGEDGARGAPRARPQPGCGLLWVTIPSRCTAGPPPTGRSARPRSSGGAEVGAAPPPPPPRARLFQQRRPPHPSVPFRLLPAMPQTSEHRLGRARDPTVVAAQPKAASKLPGRAVSQERHPFSAAPGGLSPAPKLRLLPPRPATLEERPKKSDPERGRAAKRGSACRRGPLKADHGVRVPGSPQAGAAPGVASFPFPVGTERRRSNLSRSKSVSIGDVSGEDAAAALSRLALRDGGHPANVGASALKRSSSLRRVNVGTAAADGRSSAPLLSVRHDGCARTRVADPPYGPDGPAPRSPPHGGAPEKPTAVRDGGAAQCLRGSLRCPSPRRSPGLLKPSAGDPSPPSAFPRCFGLGGHRTLRAAAAKVVVGGGDNSRPRPVALPTGIPRPPFPPLSPGRLCPPLIPPSSAPSPCPE